MPKLASEMTAVEVKRLYRQGLHFVGGVPGLALQVLPTGGRTWVLRAVIGTRRRDMGLGGYPEVPLAEARQKGREVREKIRQGIDPIAELQAARSALRASLAAALTFKQCSEKYIAAHGEAWRNAKHAKQWEATLAQYAYPVIGELHVRDVALAHVLQILEPIWTTKTETASRLRGRIENVLDWAKGRGYRAGDNPAAWKGNLDAQLPRPQRVKRVVHYPAVAIDEMGDFIAELRQRDGSGARALEFAILTAARSGEVRGMEWSEVDLITGIWTVPAGRMKASREHRVPLSKQAKALLENLPRFEGNELVFPAPRGGKLSDMSLSAVMRRLERTEVPHGFRSTFRDWAAERTHYPSDMAEMALAHTISDKVEAAYRRGDMMEKRRRMMQEWADFCELGGRPSLLKI